LFDAYLLLNRPSGSVAPVCAMAVAMLHFDGNALMSNVSMGARFVYMNE
jgi:hypothetical protein